MIRLDRAPRRLSIPRAPAIALLVILVLMLTKLILERQAEGLPEMTTCHFKNATGSPCAFCGGTRATVSMASGDFLEAILWNPLVVLTNILVALWLLLRFGFGRALRWRLPPGARPWIWAGAVALLAANWVYVAHHLH